MRLTDCTGISKFNLAMFINTLTGIQLFIVIKLSQNKKREEEDHLS